MYQYVTGCARDEWHVSERREHYSSNHTAQPGVNQLNTIFYALLGPTAPMARVLQYKEMH